MLSRRPGVASIACIVAIRRQHLLSATPPGYCFWRWAHLASNEVVAQGTSAFQVSVT